MTESSLLTAIFPMNVDSYKSFIKSASDEFATAVASIVIDSGKDWLVLRYLKKEQAAYLAFVFHWADRAVITHPYLEA